MSERDARIRRMLRNLGIAATAFWILAGTGMACFFLDAALGLHWISYPDEDLSDFTWYDAIGVVGLMWFLHTTVGFARLKRRAIRNMVWAALVPLALCVALSCVSLVPPWSPIEARPLALLAFLFVGVCLHIACVRMGFLHRDVFT